MKTQHETDLQKADGLFYLDSNYAQKHYGVNRAKVIYYPCTIKIYHYNKCIETYEYNHGVAHYIESVKDLKRNRAIERAENLTN